MNDLTEFKKVALEAIWKAEKRILYYFKNQPKVETKADSTPVTKADREAEEIIVTTIRKTFPSHGFMGEEFGEDKKNEEFYSRLRLLWNCTWLKTSGENNTRRL